MELLIPVLIAVVSSTAISQLIQFLIKRKDDKNDKENTTNKSIKELKEEIKSFKEETYKRLDELEADSVRTQLLTMMCDYPDNIDEIFKIAEIYFSPIDEGGMDGDWYMSGLFINFLTHQGTIIPNWFVDSCHRHGYDLHDLLHQNQE